MSVQLREFLQDRLVSYAAVFHRASDLKEVSLEKLRRLHVEHERRVAMRCFQQTHNEMISVRDSTILHLEQELERVQSERKAEQQAHALEIESLTKQLRENESMYEKKGAGLEKEMRETVGEMQRE